MRSQLDSRQTQRGGKISSGMGGSDSKLNFRKAVVQLTTKKTVIGASLVYFSQISANFFSCNALSAFCT